jgi:hypothetical protein|tara:strand:- start:236 stop:478 length:243 start_codon:yes stop_codon:yes gene_type:complete
MAHLDLVENGIDLTLDGPDGARGAYVTAFHAQDAGFLARDYVRGINRAPAVLQAEILDAPVGTHFATLAAVNATAEEFFF